MGVLQEAFVSHLYIRMIRVLSMLIEGRPAGKERDRMFLSVR